MDLLLVARLSFAMSMAFHIIFAALGIGMPVLMLVAEGVYLRTGDLDHLALAKRWARVAGVLFAVGAVSGTAIAFELGLLWPRFMQFAGPVIGMPFSFEGFAFFTEAIFLGLYLFGWDRLKPLAHWWCGVPVALGGAASALFVLDANAWMNSPTGIVMSGDRVLSYDPVAAIFNPMWGEEAFHMITAAFVATGFAVAAAHAWRLLRAPGDTGAARGYWPALVLALALAPVQVFSGDQSSRDVAHNQPTKFAAMEALDHSGPCAPITIGGLVDQRTGGASNALRIPCGLSLLLAFDPNAPVQGLDLVPADERPNVAITHYSLDVMTGIGFAFVFMAVYAFWYRWHAGRPPMQRWFLVAVVAAGCAGFIAIEAGWLLTEVGRQPWVAYHLLSTAKAVTVASNTIVPSFIGFALIYAFLAALTAWLLFRLGERREPA